MTTFFVALDVTSGQVKTGHFSRRCQRELLDFIDEVVADHPHRDNPEHIRQIKKTPASESAGGF